MNAAQNTLDTLRDWTQQRWLGQLDSALAAFMLELDPAARPVLLMCAALLARMEGRGHSCLSLRELITQAPDALAWPPAGRPALAAAWQTLPPTLADWLTDLRASALVRGMQRSGNEENTAPDPDRGQPLVLAGTPELPLLYLRRYWLLEQTLAQAIRQRSAAAVAVNEALARRWLDRLFAEESAAAEPATQTNWQKLACAVALRAGLTVITGGPGTGKTYTAARLLALLLAVHANPGPLRVALAAPTGKAAARLRQSIDSSLQDLAQRLGDTLDLAQFTQRIGAARTLHSLLGARPDTRNFLFNANRPLDIDVLIVDEASMVHLEMMVAVLQALPTSAKLILLGDKDQLASVEAGAVMGDLCLNAAHIQYDLETARFAASVAGQLLAPKHQSGQPGGSALAQQTVMLQASRRFGGQIGELASAVNHGDVGLAAKAFGGENNAVLHASIAAGPETVLRLATVGRPGAASYADYAQLLAQGAQHDAAAAHQAWVNTILQAFERFRILCAVHEGQWGTEQLNAGIQKALAGAGWLKPHGQWYCGRPVMVTRNDPALGVFNGDVGLALPSASAATALRVYFPDGQQARSVSVNRLAHVETAFAMTVHKSQGSEFLHAALVLPPGSSSVLTRELVYTAITRARKCFTLIEAQEGLLDAAIRNNSHRASGLAMQLGH
jgi:exodeoxyribonuclease V alpha subunit